MDRDYRLRFINIACALILLLSAVIVFRVNQNSHLYSDDYLYSFKFNPGFAQADPATVHYEKIESIADYFGSLSLLYRNLTGRIVPHALLQFFLLLPPWVFDLLNTLALFALTLLMTSWVVGEKRKYLLPWWLLTSILYYLAVYSAIPNLYLPAFSFNYLWTSLLVFALLIPILRFIRGHKAVSAKLGFALLMLLAGMIAGDTNEPVVPALLLALGALGLWKLWSDRKLPLWYFLSGIGVALGFAFMFFAPGNAARALYETQNAGSQNIGFSLANIKPILFSCLTILPAILIAFIGLTGLKTPLSKENLISFAFMLLLLGGTIFALLFSPLYAARLNILFVPFMLVLCLQILQQSKRGTYAWLLAFILILAPLYALKLSANYHRMDEANKEYKLFLKQIADCAQDSCLVNPRAYLDPITRENWAKPMAEYHGLRYLWVRDELSEDNLLSWKAVTYPKPASDSTQGITLQALRYRDYDPYARTLYVLLQISDPAIDPGAVSLKVYSADIKPPFLRSVYQRLPQRLRDLLLAEEPSYRPQNYKQLDRFYVYAVPMRNEDWHDDFLRLRLSGGKQRMQDIYLQDLTYIR